jgi:hypothetical protein
MDTVTLQGVDYTKASVLAKKFRYTADYLGQLCRGKKVDARLVGRAWYINLDSLLEHRANRHQTTPSAEISPKREINNYLSRVEVEPVMNHKTLRILKSKGGEFTDVPVTYEFDEQALIPKVKSHSTLSWLPILPAEAERLSVQSSLSSSTASFKPTALPEVSLSGKLSVVDASDITPETVVLDEAQESASLPEVIPESTPKNIARTVTVRPKRALKRLARQSDPVSAVVKSSARVAPAQPIAATTFRRPAVRFSPSAIKSITPSAPQSTSLGLVFPMVSTIIALFVALTIVSINFEVEVSQSSYQSRTRLQVANVLDLFTQLRE